MKQKNNNEISIQVRHTTRDSSYPANSDRAAAVKRTTFITLHNPALDESLTAGFIRLGLTWQEA